GQGLARLLGFAEAIEHLQLTRGLHEALVFVLAVNLHEEISQALEQSHGSCGVVDEDAVPAGARELALDDELAIEHAMAGLLRPAGERPRRADVEHPLHRSRRGPGQNQTGLGSSPAPEEETSNDDNLARPGFPREDVEAGAEDDAGFLDDGEVPDRELTQHGSPHARSPPRRPSNRIATATAAGGRRRHADQRPTALPT